MEQLKVIGTEDDVLVLATESGETVLARRRRRAARRAAQSAPGTRRRRRRSCAPSPREIQSHIRAGLSAEEVAALLGARVEDVVALRRARAGRARARRRSGARRARAARRATSTATCTRRSAAPCARSSPRPARSGERWTSWKEPTGWIVKLEFTASDVDHDARWGFDPRRSTLSPLNADAIQLSRQGSLPEGLIPRLRALDVATGEGRLPLRQRCVRSAAHAGRRPRVAGAAASRSPPRCRRRRSSARRAGGRPRPRPPTCSRRCDGAAVSASRCPGAEKSRPRALTRPVALFDALEPGYDEAPAR